MNNIILIGFMGSGKTTVGEILAEKLNIQFVDTDKYISDKAKMSINEIFDKFGENYFRSLETEALNELSERTDIVLSTGGGILNVAENRKKIKQCGFCVFLDVPFEVISSRLIGDTTRPLFKNIITAKGLFESRRKVYSETADLIVCSDSSPENAQQIIKKYNTKRG